MGPVVRGGSFLLRLRRQKARAFCGPQTPAIFRENLCRMPRQPTSNGSQLWGRRGGKRAPSNWGYGSGRGA